MSAAIDWVDATRQGHLHNDRISYIVKVLDDGTLGGVHFGPRLAPDRDHSHLLVGNAEGGFQDRLGEPLALEYPTAGTGDYRIPALAVEFADGSSVAHLVYTGHRIESGKPELPGLPSTYAEAPAEAQTLLLTLRDEPSGLEALLRYTIFSEVPAVARSVRITNTGDRPVRLRSVMSASLDLPDADWDLVHLSGSWSRERHVQTRRLTPGRQSISSRRGSSGHEHNPFLVLTRTTTTEDSGEALAFSLVYSGNFLAETEVDAFDTARVRIGIEPETFTWTLAPTESFEAPEAVLVYSDGGLSAMSDALPPPVPGAARAGARGAIGHGPSSSTTGKRRTSTSTRRSCWASRRRRVTSASSCSSSTTGGSAQRDDDRTSLGDWTVDRRKLPEGLDGLGRKVEALGMSFGIWIEPEMVSRRSRLFDEHPDWAIGVPGRPMTEGRSQLVLDLARPEVVDHLTRVLSELLSSAPISYVKWDMNRTITEPYSRAVPPERQGEAFHRYILGVYDLYDRLTTAFPDVLFESCAGGGGRFDPGLLAFAPQAWTSDDTDAVERLPIQWGTSVRLPVECHGCARLGRAQSPGRSHHATGDARRRRVLRDVRVRARPDRTVRRGTPAGRRPGRVLPAPPRPVPAGQVRATAWPA